MSFILNLFTKSISCQPGICISRSFCNNGMKILRPRKNQSIFFENKSYNINLPASHAYFIRFVGTEPVVKTPSVQIKKRPAKKKKGEKILSKTGCFNILAYSTAKEYDLERLMQAIEQKDVYSITDLEDDIGGNK